jgi:hypothetical protein
MPAPQEKSSMSTHPLSLTAPPALPARGLRIIPLGGLGEIGRNMTVFEHKGKLLVIDCGLLFPKDIQPGINVILPATRTTSAPCPTCSRNAATFPSSPPS